MKNNWKDFVKDAALCAIIFGAVFLLVFFTLK